MLRLGLKLAVPELRVLLLPRGHSHGVEVLRSVTRGKKD